MRICVTGGAGYVGSALVPRLLENGHEVTVLDTFWFGDHPRDRVGLTKVRGDIRFKGDLRRCFTNQDIVIHLACVSNDPSFDLNPKLGAAINYDAFENILWALRECDVRRFIYASSSSVYGISDLPEVTEDVEKKPLTDYSKFKLACEVMLKSFGTGGEWTILRPATVCGYAPRMRFDLVANILTVNAMVNHYIKINNHFLKRPNICIGDMCRAYEWAIEADKKVVNEQTFNVGFENMTLRELAVAVRSVVARKIEIIEEQTDDSRSYHISSKKILEAGFKPLDSVAYGIETVKNAINSGRLTRVMANSDYYNIKKMQELGL